MEENLSSGGVFVFQGNSLVLSPGNPAEESHEEKVRAAFGGFGVNGSDFFEVPALDNSSPVRALTLPPGLELPPEWTSVPMRAALDRMTGAAMADGEGSVGRLLRSYHISQWRADSKFCGSCGSPNGGDADEALARKCPRCGRLEFPRISPAIITIIINEKDEALLAHNKKFAPGLYSLIAGFNEAGESLEATVARETREEVGIEVKDIRYVRSQPWPFPNSLMVGFSAVYASGKIRPDGVEIEDARWFPKGELPILPGNGSVSRYLIGLWLDGKLSGNSN